MNSKTYNRIFLIGIFLILALPIFTSSPWFSPAPWGKTIVFRIILSVLIFIFLYRLLYKKIAYECSIDKNKLPFWFLAVLFLIFALATIFSLDPYYSFWESPLRAGGFLNFSFYIIFALLAFFFVKKNQWQKIWDFSILIGALISIIAVLQQYNVFKNIIIPYSGRPPSTIGGPTFLALYILLLVFITFCFIIRSIKNLDRKWFFYLPVLLLFIYVILITGSRAAYLGLLIGFIYFIFCYPQKNKKVVLVKIIFFLLLALTAYGVYYANVKTDFPEYIENNKLAKEVIPRLSINQIFINPRFSAWLISLEAIKQRPLLGYGPENFSIAFDKYYDPLLPNISKAWGSWYDKAHNLLFDIAVTVGLPGLIIFICFFASLFWELQKLKEKRSSLIAHGIQATFLAYFANNLFSFDVFSTHLILFLFVAYSFSLINNKPGHKPSSLPEEKELKPTKPIIISILLFILIWFIWSYNLKPLYINKEINWADYYRKSNQCEKALEKMEGNVLDSKSIIDNYAKLKYIEIIEKCNEKTPGLKLSLASKAISSLKQASEIRPYYTRTWLFLGSYTNLLIENKDYLEINNVEELIKESFSFYEKAEELSPKREELSVGWIQINLLTGEYQKAEERAEQCLEHNPNSSYCWWLKGLSNIYLENIKQAEIDIKTALEKDYNIDSERSIIQLTKAYLQLAETTEKTEYWEKLINLYEELLLFNPDNYQHHASLAYIYKKLGNYEKSKEEALIVIELRPDLEEDVKKFLDTLP